MLGDTMVADATETADGALTHVVHVCSTLNQTDAR